MKIPVAYTNPGHGPNPFQQPESMGKRRHASPAPFERDAKDIFVLLPAAACVRRRACGGVRAAACVRRRACGGERAADDAADASERTRSRARGERGAWEARDRWDHDRLLSILGHGLLSKDNTPMIHVDTCIIGAKCIISYYRVSSLIHVLAMY